MAAKKRSATRAAASDRRGTATATRSTSMPATQAKAAAKPKVATKRKPVGETSRASADKAPVRLEAAAGEGQSTRKAPAESAGKKVASKRSSSKQAASPTRLSEGDRAPRFTLLDEREQPLSSEDLAGHPYVLYFYPKDDTPGCTLEACGFRDAAAELEDAGVRVIGVSPDTAASHQKFITKHELPFTLLCDVEQALATAYGTWALKKNYGREYMGVVRSTFLIGADGVIRKAWRGVRVNGHVAAVQAAARQLS